jgi:hypothetical protein
MSAALASETSSRLLDVFTERLDIPQSYYERAADRHQSLGEWLIREESLLARYDPDVRPQGSFRFGTVIPSLDGRGEYDLDNVCVLKGLSKTNLTQSELKELYGREIIAYAKAHGINEPAEEHNRCWRLRYADKDFKFHLDTLPCIPEEPLGQLQVRSYGVLPELADRSVAITDRRHENYERISSLWPRSNPRGFAVWFEGRAALGRAGGFFEKRGMVEDVPPYAWKTTLQRSIQFLKRHRDVVFQNPEIADFAPISMIITNLAANAYDGETDIWLALRNIVSKMPSFVNAERPWVPNPADPAEDYADKWARDPRLKDNFWLWMQQVRVDVEALPFIIEDGSVVRRVKSAFGIELTHKDLGRLVTPGAGSATIIARPAPAVVTSGPRPWGS